jgi:hypothetical protein
MSIIGWRQMPNDTTIRIDGSYEGLASIAAATPSRAEILEAGLALEAEAEERLTMHPKHMLTLFTALVCRRSPYIVEMEKELAAYRGDESFSEYFVRHRPDLRDLFRSEIRKVIAEAQEERTQ